MMSLPLAHIGGIPIEETLASTIPALLLTFGAASATLRARLHRALPPPARPRAEKGAGQRVERPR